MLSNNFFRHMFKMNITQWTYQLYQLCTVNHGCQLKDTKFSYILSDAFKNVTIHSLKIQEQSHVNAFLIWPQTIRRWSLFPVQRSRDLYHSSIGLPATLRMYCSILLTADDLEMSVLLSNDFDLTEVLQK